MFPQLRNWLSKKCATFSSSPTIRPPITAPRMLSSPPRITAGKTLMPKKERAEDTPLTVPTTTPPPPDPMAEIAQLREKVLATEMPTDYATAWLRPVLRISRTILEYLKNQPKP